MMFLLLGLFVLLDLVAANKPAPILFLIQSQEGTFHQGIAERTKTSILKQWDKFVPSHVMNPPKVMLTTELEDSSLHERAWTYTPLFNLLADELEDNQDIDWVGILNENTEISIQALGQYASQSKGKLNPRDEYYFMGKSLKDESPTIIHHFHVNSEKKTVLYPDPEPGMFLSRKLVLDLRGKKKSGADFHIDPQFEFADLVLTELGVSLTHVEELCSKEPKKSGKMCITYPRQEYKCLKNKDLDGLKEMLDSVYVITNTCEKYHETRIPVIQKTWSDLFPNLHFISEKVDDQIPTEVLPHTINTETGYCNKTRTFLDRFMEEKDFPWLLITDDDTIISPVRFAQMLACYPTDEPVISGQRYGYMTASGHGYNYVTGGGGKIINKAAVNQLLSLDDSCACPAANTPEDMHIFGICAKRAGISINHSGRMFQARPVDYPSSMISYRKPVSFHKHWEIDPVQVYEDWFRKSDNTLREHLKAKSVKEEL